MLYTIKNLQKIRPASLGYQLIIRHLMIQKGQFYAITGPSGCGKSTALDLLGLTLRPEHYDKFQLNVANQCYDIGKLYENNAQEKLTKLRLNHMGYVLQTGELLACLNVLDNILVTAKLSKQDPHQAHERAQMLCAQLGIERRLHAYPKELSVGERQRCAIARALITKPAILLCDEPTSSLDPLHADKVMNAFLSLSLAQKTTVLLVTHSTNWVKSMGIPEIVFELKEQDGFVQAVLDDR